MARKDNKGFNLLRNNLKMPLVRRNVINRLVLIYYTDRINNNAEEKAKLNFCN